ncbi:2-dehydro-3-deoxygalactonokinase [Pleomorphovibrio marinus]|uniref:2-dehydro-3-deoxygalactonokinase n=1 Tax=Pleomorphovibrio marinus TaxID=2164132 RepID=UPI000E0AF9A5|nr:2-dehydro-3-deoxygalactonokinase [Pleomorphovibrio marinus]
MLYFISCDWGTSSFRISLVKSSNLDVLYLHRSEKGIGQVNRSLTDDQRQTQSLREKAYLVVIKEGIEVLEKQSGLDLKGTLVICSGMATSSIGLRELPFTPLPFSTDGRNLGLAFLTASPFFDFPLVLLSGLKHSSDLLRGEETQLVGVVHQLADFDGIGVFIFPGTHSKHIFVHDHEVRGFNTFMTGELFALLSQNSILQSNVEAGGSLEEDSGKSCFLEGVKDSEEGNILSRLFQVRTSHLLKGRDPKLNFLYLSGLLIGTELRGLKANGEKVYLCATEPLHTSYSLSLQALSIPSMVVPPKVVEHSVIAGQFKIYNQKLNHERSIFLGNI